MAEHSYFGNLAWQTAPVPQVSTLSSPQTHSVHHTAPDPVTRVTIPFSDLPSSSTFPEQRSQGLAPDRYPGEPCGTDISSHPSFVQINLDGVQHSGETFYRIPPPVPPQSDLFSGGSSYGWDQQTSRHSCNNSQSIPMSTTTIQVPDNWSTGADGHQSLVYRGAQHLHPGGPAPGYPMQYQGLPQPVTASMQSMDPACDHASAPYPPPPHSLGAQHNPAIAALPHTNVGDGYAAPPAHSTAPPQAHWAGAVDARRAGLAPQFPPPQPYPTPAHQAPIPEQHHAVGGTLVAPPPSHAPALPLQPPPPSATGPPQAWPPALSHHAAAPPPLPAPGSAIPLPPFQYPHAPPPPAPPLQPPPPSPRHLPPAPPPHYLPPAPPPPGGPPYPQPPWSLLQAPPPHPPPPPLHLSGQPPSIPPTDPAAAQAYARHPNLPPPPPGTQLHSWPATPPVTASPYPPPPHPPFPPPPLPPSSSPPVAEPHSYPLPPHPAMPLPPPQLSHGDQPAPAPVPQHAPQLPASGGVLQGALQRASSSWCPAGAPGASGGAGPPPWAGALPKSDAESRGGGRGTQERAGSPKTECPPDAGSGDAAEEAKGEGKGKERAPLAVGLFPRRKKTEEHRAKDHMVVELEQVKQLFHLPLRKAAIKLGISTTALKSVCRKLGLTRWPYKLLKQVGTSDDCLALLLETESPGTAP